MTLTRYRPTQKASAELRQDMGLNFYIPGPRSLEELRDFSEYLTERGVSVTWLDLGSFLTDRDYSPYAWPWRVQRGEAMEKKVQ